MSISNESSISRKRRLQRERTERYRKKKANEGRHDLGNMDQECLHCDAKFWLHEKIKIAVYLLLNLQYVVQMVKSIYLLC